MKNRIYPCILKGSYDWLAYDKNNAIALHGDYDKNKGFIDFDRDGFTNITAEYLKNTYGKVESPEHAEFIIDLCKGNGIKTYKYHSQIAEYFMINKNKLSFVTAADCAIRNDLGYPSKKQITIPMPPKKQDWPQVGDEVVWGDKSFSGEVKAISDGLAWIKFSHDNFVTERLSELSKPKTEDEVLRDELTTLILPHCDSKIQCSAITIKIAEYISTKKPQ